MELEKTRVGFDKFDLQWGDWLSSKTGNTLIKSNQNSTPTTPPL